MTKFEDIKKIKEEMLKWKKGKMHYCSEDTSVKNCAKYNDIIGDDTLCKDCYVGFRIREVELQTWKEALTYQLKDLDEDIKWLQDYINETNKLRRDAIDNYGTFSNIPRNYLMLMRGDTIHKFEAKLAQKQKDKAEIEQEIKSIGEGK